MAEWTMQMTSIPQIWTYAILSWYILFLEVYALLIQIMYWVRYQGLASLIWHSVFLSFNHRPYSSQHKLSYGMNTLLRWNNTAVDWLYIKFIIGFMCIIYLSWTQGTETWTGGGHAAYCCSLSLQLRRQHFSVGWDVQTLLLSLITQLMYKHCFVILITVAHHIFARMWPLLFEVRGWTTCTAGGQYGFPQSTNGARLQKYWADGQVGGHKELGYSTYLVTLRMLHY